MRDDLLNYYERELTFLRQMGAEFANRYPKVASRLLLEPDRCEDPHVERLIEASALLAARVHKRLDDDFPEITQAMLNVVYPHYTRPLPAMSVAEFHLREGGMTTPIRIPRNSMLFSKPVEGMPCRFRTSYDTDVWPMRVSEAQWLTPDRLDPPLRATDAVAVLRVRIDCWPDVHLKDLPLSSLRFYLNGELPLVHTLYELLCNNCQSIILRDPRPGFRHRPIELIPDALRPVGFADNEGMLPYSKRSFSGYRILQEYFAFPEKFFFLDLMGLDALRVGDFKDRFEILFLISPFERTDRHQLLEVGVGPRTVRLGCSPIVNLFGHTAEPIQLDQTRFEYPVVPDFRHGRSMDIFSIDEVLCTYEATGKTAPFEPFYSFQHGAARKDTKFWNATRSTGGPRGGDRVLLSLVDTSGHPLSLNLDTLTIRCTCSNGELPARLPFGDERGDFVLEEGSAIDRVIALRKPSAVVRPPVGREALWRLISHLSLNYLSLVEDGREALQEILRLYHHNASSLDQQIEGIAALSSERKFARVIGDHGISYVRGLRVKMELDEDRFVGGGVYLFASVIEHFLAQYVSMNSFSQLAVGTRQRKELIREWAPRTGNRILM
ncbi:MAG: type VI secretion system baseplate subunit TssF [Acidobacteriota bacterium]